MLLQAHLHPVVLMGITFFHFLHNKMIAFKIVLKVINKLCYQTMNQKSLNYFLKALSLYQQVYILILQISLHHNFFQIRLMMSYQITIILKGNITFIVKAISLNKFYQEISQLENFYFVIIDFNLQIILSQRTLEF